MFTALLISSVLLAAPCTGGPLLREGEKRERNAALDTEWKARLMLEGQASRTLEPSLVNIRAEAYCRRVQATSEAQGGVTPDRALLARLAGSDEDGWQKLERAIEEWLSSLGDGLQPDSTASGVHRLVRWGAIVVVVLALLAAAARVVRSTRGSKVRRVLKRTPPEVPAFLEPSESHLIRAFENAGIHPRDSLRESWLAVLSSLEEHRLANPRRVDTNQEVAESLPARGAPPALTQHFRELARRYDDAFYSLAPVTPELARLFLSQVSAFRSALEGTTP